MKIKINTTYQEGVKEQAKIWSLLITEIIIIILRYVSCPETGDEKSFCREQPEEKTSTCLQIRMHILGAFSKNLTLRQCIITTDFHIMSYQLCKASFDLICIRTRFFIPSHDRIKEKQQFKIENTMEQERCVSHLEKGSAGAVLEAGNLQSFSCYLLNVT